MSVFLNLDFIFYLIYIFFRSIFNFLSGGFIQADSNMNIFTLLRFMSSGDISQIEMDKYQAFGEGIGALYDGYSLFTPPHGLNSFGGFSGWWQNFTTNPYCTSCSSFSDLFFGGINGFLWFFIIVMLIALYFVHLKLAELGEIESIMCDTVYEQPDYDTTGGKDDRWKKILQSTHSKNVNDWKTAIIDADNLLDETLREHGYTGETLGEKLKAATFATLQNAWTAHNIRNKIAHEPNFILTKREAERVIKNYKTVFSEFYYI